MKVLGSHWASQVALVVKKLPANTGDMRLWFSLWVGKILWRRAWQPTSVFLPGEFHGQRSLAGYSPWGSQRLKQFSTGATESLSRRVTNLGEIDSFTCSWQLLISVIL